MGTSLQKFTAQRASSALVPASIAEAMQIGQLMKMFDADGNEANAVAKVVAGMEFGIGPMASIRGIHMIKGKPNLSADLLATLIKRSGRYDFRSKVGADFATVTIYDRGEALDPVTFTIDDAKTAGLYESNPNYKKYGPDMYYTKAMVRAVRRHCPEVAGGAVYEEDGEGPPEQAPGRTISSAPQAQGDDVIDSTATDEPAFDAAKVAEQRYEEIKALAVAQGFDADRMKQVWAAAEVEAQVDLADDVKFERAKAAVTSPPQDETLPGTGAAGEDPPS